MAVTRTATMNDRNSRRALLETVSLAATTALLVWAWPPDVNEAHYLGKARHFHDRSWCANDLFIASHETHWLFYWSVGWLTRVFPLEAVAWIGRSMAWLITSWGLLRLWQVLSANKNRRAESLVFISLATGINEYMNLAGEWIAGGIEAKSMAYGFVFAALADWLRGDRWRAALWLSMASGFHIVLGLWTVLAMVIASLGTLFRNESGAIASRHELPAGRNQKVAIAFAAVLFFAAGLIPALHRNFGQPADLVGRAAEVQAFSRLAHHQDVLQFDPVRWIAFLVTVAIWLILWRATWRLQNREQRRFNGLASAALAIAFSGILISIAGHFMPQWRSLAAVALSLYWFRLVDALVPLALVVNLQCLAGSREIRGIVSLATMAVIAMMIANLWNNIADPRSGSARQASGVPGTQREIEADQNWRLTCEWIRQNTPHDAIFVTPSGQQTFKWYAHRAEVASWKDMPQDAAGVVEWNRRIDRLYRAVPQSEFGVLGLYDHEIRAIAAETGATHLVAERRQVEARHSIGYLPSFRQIWPASPDSRSTFIVFELGGVGDHNAADH